MTDVYSGTLKRYYFVIALVILALAIMLFLNVQNKNRLKAAERDVRDQFSIFKIHEYPKKIPSINVTSPTGDVIDLSKLRDHYTILNVWATWCTPCIKELPSLRKLDEQFQRHQNKKWKIIAVSIDDSKNMERVMSFAQKYGVSEIANYHDYNLELQKNISVSKLPLTLILNPSGQILYEIYGDAFWFDAEIVNFLNLVTKAR